MRPVHCELLWLKIPFQRRFVHARSERDASETLLVLLMDAKGRTGMGEVLPRSYVTGEDLWSSLEVDGPELATSILGRRFGSQEALARWIAAQLEDARWGPALFGGFESALIDLYGQVHAIDLTRLLGPVRRSPAGRCVTIGFDCPTEDLPKYAKAARIGRTTAVKLKVGAAGDAERIRALGRVLPREISLRLDGNGAFSLDEALRLLQEARGIPIESVEQPFAAGEPDLRAKLIELHRRGGASLMADESVCTVQDARHWAEGGGYQWFNVRVGKSGGMLGAATVARLARSHGIDLVCGTMVGETEVLDRASELLFAHSDCFPYVEGLGQHRFLLSARPVRRGPTATGGTTFVLDQEVVEQCLVTRRTIGD